MTNPITPPPLSGNEFNAVLAGLRSLQYLMDKDQVPTGIREILTNGGQGLGLDQIDLLCQRLNCA